MKPEDPILKNAVRLRFGRLLWRFFFIPLVFFFITAFALPSENVPFQLKEAWLRFHETDLCLDVDAKFDITNAGMEIRSWIDDENSYQKLLKLIEPLRGAFQINLYPTRPSKEEKAEKDKNLFPSLWENLTLRMNIGDPVIRNKSINDDEVLTYTDSAELMLRNRIQVFGNMILSWSKKMERYSSDLPALAAAAIDPAVTPAIRAKAKAICLEHAQGIGKCIMKLESNLAHAFPKPEKKGRRPAEPLIIVLDDIALVESAGRFMSMTGNVSGRVHDFIQPKHPDHMAVEIEDLRRPGILQSLKYLQQAADGFNKELSKIP